MRDAFKSVAGNKGREVQADSLDDINTPKG